MATMPEIDWDKPVECKAIRGDWWRVVQRCVSSTGYVAYVVECPDNGSIQTWHEHSGEYLFRNVRRKVKHRQAFYLCLHERGGARVFMDYCEADNYRRAHKVIMREHVEEWEAEVDE